MLNSGVSKETQLISLALLTQCKDHFQSKYIRKHNQQNINFLGQMYNYNINCFTQNL